MRRTLIITILALFAMPIFAQNIESVDVAKAPNGKFTTTIHESTIEGTVYRVSNVFLSHWLKHI